MAEAALIAGIVDELTGGGIHGAAGSAHDGLFDAEELGGQDGIIHAAHLLGRLADGNGTGHIGAVAAPVGAVIHSEEVALPQGTVAGDGVGLGGIGTAGGNGLKGKAIRAQTAHAVFQVGGNLFFGLAGLDEIEDLQEGGIGDALRLADSGDLLLVLEGAHLQDLIIEGGGSEELHLRQTGTVLLQAAHGDVVGFDGDGSGAVLLQQLAQLVVQLILQDDLGTGDGGLGDLDIAEINDEIGGIPERQQCAGGGAQSGKVAAVHIGGDESGIGPLRQGFHQFFNAVHA